MSSAREERSGRVQGATAQQRADQDHLQALREVQVRRDAPRALLVALGWLLLFLLLSAALLRGMVDTRQLAVLWEQAAWPPLLLAFFVLFGGLFFMGLRWRALLPGRSGVSRLGIAGICAAGQLMNMALPGPVGELAQAALVQRSYGVDAPVALAASVHARFVGVTSGALIALAVWLLAPLPIPESARPLVSGAVILVAFWGGVLAAVAFWPRLLLVPLRFGLDGISRWRPGHPRAWLERGFRLLLGFAEALSTLGQDLGWPHLAAAGYNLLGVASITSGAWIASWALGQPGDPAGLLFTQCALTAGAVMLFAMPGMQVGWDAGFAALLVTTVGLPVEHALAITVMVRCQQLVVAGLGAAVLAWAVRREPGSGAAVQGDAPREGSG